MVSGEASFAVEGVFAAAVETSGLASFAAVANAGREVSPAVKPASSAHFRKDLRL